MSNRFNPITASLVTNFEVVKHFFQLDHRAVLEQVAHHNLDTLLEAVQSLGPQAWDQRHFKPEWMDEVIRLLAVPDKVRAIKLVREQTGLGLYESKQIADTISGFEHRTEIKCEKTLGWYAKFVEFGLAQPYQAPVIKAPEPATVPVPEVITYIATILMPDSMRDTFCEEVCNWHTHLIGVYPSNSEAWARVHDFESGNNHVGRFPRVFPSNAK